eukprot:IDg4935t1
MTKIPTGNSNPDLLVQTRIAKTADAARHALCAFCEYGAERALQTLLHRAAILTPRTLLYHAADTSPLLSRVPHLRTVALPRSHSLPATISSSKSRAYSSSR